MLTTPPDTSAELAVNLLVHYSFDLNGYSASELINRWRSNYPTNWLHLAVIEALYQGRYKAISVQQILNFWLRRGEVIYHFNMEFERLICSKFPASLTKISPPVLPQIPPAQPIEPTKNPQLLPAHGGNYYRESHTASRSLATGELESRVLTSPSFKVSADTSKRQLAASVSQKLMSQRSLIPNQLPKLLPGNANNPPIGQFTPQRSDITESFTSKLKAMTGEEAEFAV
ncbi:hypothetical protein A0J48_025670 [Sphaerospermopsis aphanizomenoides BCCUSP55]|uniref:hypothetical protein n=1 Tax=Sphaerospermopsis aphanizomenoides TaxID=459663 RepID=UPI000AB1D11D|nr:hypothetical protein [Sphaerospermopsis aphanizomenoides]MBK1990855.1 hypothetical protein [Sphaerospermopsis aphanizomenoides BCCUSP55]